MSQKFRRAKFRNAEFYVSESEASFGRRTVDHEYPNRNEPYSEDLGRRAREFSVEAYVVGANATAERDALIAAIEEAGPGILLHPYYGQRRVTATCRVRETVSELRKVTLSITFKEAGEAKFPSASQDTKFNLKNSAGIFGNGAIADFISKFSVSGRPNFVVQSAADKLVSLTDSISGLSNSGSSTYGASASLAFAMRALKESAASSLQSPGDTAGSIRSGFNLLTSTFGSVTGLGRDKFRAAAALLTFGSSDVIVAPLTETRLQEETNRVAMNDLVKRMAIEQAAVAATDYPFSSIEEAMTVRDTLLGALDEQELTASDEMYEVIGDLRARIVAAVPEPDKSLPSVTDIKLHASTNALELAYRLYGNLNLVDDIVDRNQIENPCFIPGGRTVEVLSNG